MNSYQVVLERKIVRYERMTIFVPVAEDLVEAQKQVLKMAAKSEDSDWELYEEIDHGVTVRGGEEVK